MNSGIINNNIVVFQDDDLELDNSYGIYLDEGYLKGLTIDSNVFSTTTGAISMFYGSDNWGEETDDVTFSNNIFNAITTDVSYLGFFRTDRDWTFTNNWYYTPRTVNEMWIDEPYQWDDFITNFEPEATRGDIPYTFPDDTKTVETYMSSQGEDGTKDAFLEKN